MFPYQFTVKPGSVVEFTHMIQGDLLHFEVLWNPTTSNWVGRCLELSSSNFSPHLHIAIDDTIKITELHAAAMRKHAPAAYILHLARYNERA